MLREHFGIFIGLVLSSKQVIVINSYNSVHAKVPFVLRKISDHPKHNFCHLPDDRTLFSEPWPACSAYSKGEGLIYWEWRENEATSTLLCITFKTQQYCSLVSSLTRRLSGSKTEQFRDSRVPALFCRLRRGVSLWTGETKGFGDTSNIDNELQTSLTLMLAAASRCYAVKFCILSRFHCLHVQEKR